MKIWKSLFSAAAMVLLAAGCTEEMEPAQVGVDTSVTFTAEIAEAPTKAVLDYEAKLSKWSGEEYITILNGQDNYTFKATVAEPAAEATFALADEKQWHEPEEGVVAVYPMGGSYALDNADMTVSGVTVPVEQKPLEDTYDVLAPVMMAYTTDKALSFKNAVSLVRFKVMEEGIWNVTIKANGGEKMTGAYNLRWNDGNPQLVAVAPAAEGDVPQKDHVALWYGGEGDSFTAGRYYYAAVAPGTYAEGFTVSMNNTEVRVTSESKTLERCRIYDLGELVLPEAEAWGICGTMTNWGEEETPDLALEAEGDWLVYRGLAMGIMDRFQFRADNEWGRQYGYEGIASSGETYEFTGEHKNDIYVWEPAIYDVYLAKDLSSFKVVKVGDIEGKPAAKNWGVVGSMTQWGGSEEAPVADITMTTEGNMYVARNVTVYKSGGFKFRVDGLWYEQLGLPGVAEGETLEPVKNATPYTLMSGGESVDIIVAESGVYDIFLSAYEDGFRIMKVADAVEPEPEPEPEVTPGEESEWALVGAFVVGDANWHEIRMYTTATENLFVAKGVEVPADYTSMLIKKFGDSTWSVKYGGGILYFNPDNWMTVYEGGSDISVTKAGTYDFYFDKANNRLYAVTADSDHTTVPEQTVDGEAPELEEPEVTDAVLYLQPHEEWFKYGENNNGWFFAAYFFGAGDTWIQMEDAGDGYYRCNVPEGGYTSVIFVQMYGNKKLADKWNAKKNQTVDLTIPTDGKNLFVMENPWNGDMEWKATGTWSTK